jgi:hypothetical protein
MVREAADTGEGRQKAAALSIGYMPDYWSRVLSCERGITLDRLGRLPLDVQRALVSRWAQALDLSVIAADDGLQGLVELIAARKVRLTLESLEPVMCAHPECPGIAQYGGWCRVHRHPERRAS